jgi:hypothetical protein
VILERMPRPPATCALFFVSLRCHVFMALLLCRLKAKCLTASPQPSIHFLTALLARQLGLYQPYSILVVPSYGPHLMAHTPHWTPLCTRLPHGVCSSCCNAFAFRMVVHTTCTLLTALKAVPMLFMFLHHMGVRAYVHLLGIDFCLDVCVQLFGCVSLVAHWSLVRVRMQVTQLLDVIWPH